jgi:hypothetical protein
MSIADARLLLVAYSDEAGDPPAPGALRYESLPDAYKAAGVASRFLTIAAASDAAASCPENAALYECILRCGAGESPAPFLLSVRTDIGAEHETEYNAWYDREHMPNLVGVPGVRAGRRYRKVAGEGSRYLALYDLDHGEIRKDPAWDKARLTEWAERVRPNIRNPAVTIGRRVV